MTTMSIGQIIILPLSVPVSCNHSVSFFRRRVRMTSDKCQQKPANELGKYPCTCDRTVTNMMYDNIRLRNATAYFMPMYKQHHAARDGRERMDRWSRCQQTTFGFSSLYVPFEKEHVAYSYYIYADDDDDDDEHANGEMRRAVANEEKESQFIPISFDMFCCLWSAATKIHSPVQATWKSTCAQPLAVADGNHTQYEFIALRHRAYKSYNITERKRAIIVRSTNTARSTKPARVHSTQHQTNTHANKHTRTLCTRT